MLARRAFSLIELLAVITIVSVVASLAAPALSTVLSAGSVNKAAADLSSTLEFARVYAVANSTYVRVAFGTVPGTGGNPASTVVLAIVAADGTLDHVATPDMEDAARWKTLSMPVAMHGFILDSTLGNSTDDKPSMTNVAAFSRSFVGLGKVSFASCIQFGPTGEARVDTSKPSRHIAVGVDKAAAQSGRNPFVVRLSGVNGSMSLLRKEDL